VDRVILAGGGQAVAALAYGTETIPRVDKIVGPGNIYVATAKRLLYGVVDIDMVAGPSEILIIADEPADEGVGMDAGKSAVWSKPAVIDEAAGTAEAYVTGAAGRTVSFAAGRMAAFAAADMLSQAEHDPNSAAILLTTNKALAAEAATQLAAQLDRLARKETARQALSQNGLIIVCRSEDEMVRLANEIAPEHLEILTADPFALLTRIKNAGSVFLGPWTPEPVGDYYSGTNHVLPTNGTARFASPLGVYDFVKRMSYTRYTEEALRQAAKDIDCISNAEGLTAHANAIKIRFDG
jgi:histidinol dehydrogenase